MMAVASGISAALVQSVWQDAAVAALLLAVLRLLKNSSANARYVACCAGLALMALLPVVTFVGVYGVSSAGPSPAAAGMTLSSSGQSAVSPDVAEYSQTRSRIWTNLSLSERSALAFLQPWILPLWIAGVLALSVRLVYAATHSIGLRKRAAPAADETLATVARLAASLGVRRKIQVLVTDHFLGIGTIGWMKPIILLPPAAFLGLTPQQVEALLAHEIAHVRRWDYLVNVLQVIVETLFFYHPAVWWASTRIRIERELCCDDAAVKACGDPIEYARALTAVARYPLARHGVVAATDGTLVSRIQRLLQPSALTTAAAPGSAIVLVTVVALAGSALTAPLVGAQSTQRRALAAESGSLSLAVYDPFGDPAADVVLVFEQGPFQTGVLFGEGRTDGNGLYRVRLPPGEYVFSALSDFFPPTTVTVTAGETMHHDIRMKVEAVTSSFTVCLDCPSSATPVMPSSIAEELRRDREAAASQVVAPAEPAGGWESYTPGVPPLLAQRRDIPGGTVIVEGRIAANGRLLDVTIVSAAHAVLADAVRAAIQAERWLPARVRGVPIETPLRLTIDYVRQGSQQ